jgi:hypothetical protein
VCLRFRPSGKRSPIRDFDKEISTQEGALSNLNDQSNSVPLKEYLLTIFAFEREMTDREKVFVNLRFELAERAL